MIIEMTQEAYGLAIGQQISVGEALGLHLMTYASAKLIDATDSTANVSKTEQGAYGYRIIVGSAAVVAPNGFCYGGFNSRTDGVIISELKVGATAIVAGAVGGEEVLKTVPLVLAISDGWLPFLNKVTSIKLTAGTDSIIAWLKPLV